MTAPSRRARASGAADVGTRNRRTIEGYERCAQAYADGTAPASPGVVPPALRRLADALPANGRVLEIGSGPGWDADALESLGARVHRTDATAAFRALQAERGLRVDPLDLLADPIAVPAGHYDGALMLCVIQHFERRQAGRALRKLAAALAGGGPLLLSHPVGEGADLERAESGDYLVVRWSEAGMDALLAWAGFTVDWTRRDDCGDGVWRTVLARKRA